MGTRRVKVKVNEHQYEKSKEVGVKRFQCSAIRKLLLNFLVTFCREVKCKVDGKWCRE